jgi:hypothetical protein
MLELTTSESDSIPSAISANESPMNPATFKRGEDKIETDAEVSGNRPGEVFSGMQGVILLGKGNRPTISGQYLRRLYASPAPELDLGTFVQSGAVLMSDDLAGFHFDINGLVLEQ